MQVRQPAQARGLFSWWWCIWPPAFPSAHDMGGSRARAPRRDGESFVFSESVPFKKFHGGGGCLCLCVCVMGGARERGASPRPSSADSRTPPLPHPHLRLRLRVGRASSRDPREGLQEGEGQGGGGWSVRRMVTDLLGRGPGALSSDRGDC